MVYGDCDACHNACGVVFPEKSGVFPWNLSIPLKIGLDKTLFNEYAKAIKGLLIM